MADWRESLKALINTPPVLGVTLMGSDVSQVVEEYVGSVNCYLRKVISAHCDPDVLEQTAQKNADLMTALAKINEKIERGDLVEVKRGEWLPFNDEWFDFFICSECGRKEFKKEPYCHCGAKMHGGEDDADQAGE